MDELERARIGTIPLWVGANKPRSFYGCDPRMFIPMIVFILIGMFSRNLLTMAVCGALCALCFFGGRMLATWSPYFIDEFWRWLGWRSRTGGGPMAGDAYFHARNSPSADQWRKI